jgi:hypothetical protein
MSCGINEEPHRSWWNCELRAVGRHKRQVGPVEGWHINCIGGLVAVLQGVAITMGHNEPGWMQES